MWLVFNKTVKTLNQFAKKKKKQNKSSKKKSVFSANAEDFFTIFDKIFCHDFFSVSSYEPYLSAKHQKKEQMILDSFDRNIYREKIICDLLQEKDHPVLRFQPRFDVFKLV